MTKSRPTTEKFDLLVIGGGPAGLMAAGTAAARGARVLLLEKNSHLGKKLLITGGGRCNITNGERNIRTLLANYKDSQDFLFSAFVQYGVEDTLTFFHERGLNTKEENDKRMFPITDSAASVLSVLERYIEAGQVVVRTNATVAKIHTSSAERTISSVKLTDGTIHTASSYVVATGGLSRPETGSTGDGFLWLESLGHTVAKPDPSLVPLTLTEAWIKDLAGVTLPEVQISIESKQGKEFSRLGKILFTHVGVSGPTILNLSKQVGELLPYGQVKLILDLFPKLDEGALDRNLTALFQEHSNKQFKNTLPSLLPHSLANSLVSLATINPELPCHSITKEERKGLVKLLKSLTLTVKGLQGTDKAIVTSGGVALKEVNFKTMQSRLYPNLYLIGDILNIDRPSGGFSLQLCWTTGFVAGNAVPIPTKVVST